LINAAQSIFLFLLFAFVAVTYLLRFIHRSTNAAE